MDNGIINRAKKLILRPIEVWNEIAQENTPSAQVLTGYVLPLALIPAIASFIGYGFIGFNVGIFGQVASVKWGVGQAVSSLAGTFVGIVVSAYMIKILAPNFSTQLSFGKAISLVSYAYTPALVAGVFYVVPALAILALVGGIYSLYVLYLGFQPMTGVPQSHKSGYFWASLVVTIIVFVVVSVVVAAILGAAGLIYRTSL
jgi:hypothetical protein